MSNRDSLQVVIGLTVVMLVLVGCTTEESAAPIPLTPTADFSSYAPEIARLLEAHRVTGSLDSFELLELRASIFSFSSSGAFDLTVASGSVLTMTSHHIQGASPNISAQYELTTEDYRISAETRFVDRTLYFQGQREMTSDDSEDLEPMPEGWVTIGNPEDWPALDRLPLDSYFEEQYQFALFDEDWDIWHFEPTEASIARGAADDGTPADIVKITWSGEAIESRWTDQLADGFQVTTDSKIEITAAIDDEGRVIQYIWNNYEELVKQDEYKNVFTQISSSLTSANLTSINAPIEPVNAP